MTTGKRKAGLRAAASLLTLVLLAFTPALAQERSAAGIGAAAPTGSAEAFISVVGQGIAHGEPDVANLTVGAVALDPDVRTAVGEVDRLVAQVMERLEEMGMAREDMRTVSYNVWREERYPPPPQPLAEPAPDAPDAAPAEEQPSAAYRAQHMLTVRIAGAQRAGEVLAAAVEAGANSVGGITFELSDPAELEAQARQLAVADAERRAEQLARAAGVELGRTLSIRELTQGVPVGFGFERASLMSFDAAPVAPGELSVEVRILIDYSIEERQGSGQ